MKWIPYVTPFAVFIVALAVRGALEGPVADAGHDARYLYALQVVAAAVVLIVFAPRLPELRDATRTAAHWVLALVVGVAVFLVWINADAPWMRIGEPVATFVAADQAKLRWDLIALRCAGAVLLVPIIEEVFWRSFLMRWIDSRDFVSLTPASVTLFAWIASSAVFALAHDLWLAGFAAGLAYGWLYKHTGNLWAAIVAHAVTNLLLASWVVSGGRWQFW